MKAVFVVLLTMVPLWNSSAQDPVPAGPGKSPAVTNAEEAKHNAAPEAYHAGTWEQAIGYSQAVRAGRTVYISGTVGADEKGFAKDMEGQVKLAYAAIRNTLAHFGADLSNVVKERIFTTDIEALIKCQELRKGIYGAWLPAATWVEIKRLYSPEAKLEIEVEAVLSKD
jgi:2-iminobutanoate/2-iminopropanoate deaminase